MANRYVIYSAVVGKYDDITQPQVIDSSFDYILFTNDINDTNIGIWQIRHISYQNTDSTRICRYVKTHPEELLPEYEVSIWMDSNVQITSDYLYSKIIELDKQNVLISSMCHPSRDCIYQEAFAVMNMMVEREKIVVPWCAKLRKQGYPQHYGLCETNVLYRKHTTIIHQTDALWWDCIDNYSRRDQLSFNYSLWKMNIPCVYFSGEGNCVRNSEDFAIVVHNNISHNHCNIDKNEAWLMRYCWKDKKKTEQIEQLYFKLYRLPFPLFWVALFGQLFRIKYLLEKHNGRV